MKPAAVLMLVCAALAVSPALADDDDDLDRLRDAVKRGEVMPLSNLQRRLAGSYPGEVIKVELDEDDGRFIYEFRVLQANGRLIDIEMDAATGAIVDVDDDD